MSDHWRNSAASFIKDILVTIGPRPDKRVLDRIDNNGNYEPGNIKWSDWFESNQNQRRHKDAKLDSEKVLDIKRRLAAGEPGRSIARIHNVSEGLISDIKVGRVWRHIQLLPP